MDVSIIIVSYNTKELIFNCIQSIYEKTTGIDYEIIVVDNASVDGSQQMITENYPDIKLIELNENIGFGRANNEGVKIALGKYLLFINSDTEILNNAIQLFFDYFESNKIIIGVIGAMLLDSHDNIIHSYDHFPNLRKDLISEIKTLIIDIYGRDRYMKNKAKPTIKENNQNNDTLEVDYITGADIFMPKELFIKYEGFDPHFFMYFEETDLQYRMKKDGYKSILINGPMIKHLEGASFKTEINSFSNSRRYYFEKSNYYFYKKNFNLLTYYLFRVAHCFIQLFSIFDLTCKFNERIKYIKFIWTQTA